MTTDLLVLTYEIRRARAGGNGYFFSSVFLQEYGYLITLLLLGCSFDCFRSSFLKN